MREIISGGIVEPTERLREELRQMREETELRVRQFLEHNSLRYIVAIIGDSTNDSVVVHRNQSLLIEFFEHLAERESYAIQTGGTKDGIPEYSLELARAYDMPTIGVYPQAASQYALHAPAQTPADLVIQTPDLIYGRTSFGSETPVFVNTLHGAVALGGGYGTRAEVSTILRVNKSRVRSINDLLKKQPVDETRLQALARPIFLCPIHTTGKAAGELIETTKLEDVGSSLPSSHVTSGAQAAEFLHERLTSSARDIRSAL